jgi:hypothetical protein
LESDDWVSLVGSSQIGHERDFPSAFWDRHVLMVEPSGDGWLSYVTRGASELSLIDRMSPAAHLNSTSSDISALSSQHHHLSPASHSNTLPSSPLKTRFSHPFAFPAATLSRHKRRNKVEQA